MGYDKWNMYSLPVRLNVAKEGSLFHIQLNLSLRKLSQFSFPDIKIHQRAV